MGIHIRDWIPFQHRLGPALCLWLCLYKPIAVHVEEVMVRSATRPGFIMLCREPVRVWNQTFRSNKIVNKPIAAIWVLHRVNDHNSVLQNRIDTIIPARCEQMISSQHGRISR